MRLSCTLPSLGRLATPDGLVAAVRHAEALGVDTLWAADPVEFRGTHFRVAPSTIGLKPVQKPHPPLYLAGYAPPALRRVASLADGWLPSSLPAEALAQMILWFASVGGTLDDLRRALDRVRAAVAPGGAA